MVDAIIKELEQQINIEEKQKSKYPISLLPENIKKFSPDKLFEDFKNNANIREQQKTFYHLLGMIIGIPAVIFLGLYDWKLFIIMFFLLLANNLSQSKI